MLSVSELVVVVPTTDKARAKAFYAGVLHLKFVQDDGFALVFRLPHGMLRVVEVPGFQAAAYSLFGWEVSHIGDAVRELTASGVVFERYAWFEQDTLGVWTAPNGDKVAWFKDPDGNVLSLSEHKA